MGQEILNGDVGGNFQGVQITSGFFQLWRAEGITNETELYWTAIGGLIASFNEQQHIHLCRTCGNTSDFSLVKIPYAYKLMMQELTTMNVSSRILTEN